ncbi:uncharacterized protein LOC127249173 [Andrographis paniculata]|uniref:uncharacterized protein LOC127249173 n=1 Tax=Andrographis paniculata TaxID=175694 RepID=UPI0021E99ABB|nr:uncharacterized protein LOC127249173 [Andrographis paniculata]
MEKKNLNMKMRRQCSERRKAKEPMQDNRDGCSCGYSNENNSNVCMAHVFDNNCYFTQRPDCTNRLGHSPLQKMMAAIRVFGYGCCFDSVDEVIKIGGSSVRGATMEFCETIIRVYKKQYLRDPTPDDISRILIENKAHVFSEMIGSFDCMHWRWDAYPIAWQGQYNGRYNYLTLILEAAASQDLWIRHAFFGMPGTNSDVTILDHLPLFDKYMNGTTPPVEYEVNGSVYNLPYYLIDKIYPKHAILMQAIRNPVTAKEQTFTTLQEACRKNIERAFGVLQQKWRVLCVPVRLE